MSTITDAQNIEHVTLLAPDISCAHCVQTVQSALGELDVDEEFALLRETAQDRARKLGGLDRQTAERRLLGFLARRGWSGEPAMRAAREALDGSAPGGSGVRFR